MGGAPLEFGVGDPPREDPVLRLQARRRRLRVAHTRIIRPNAELFAVLIRSPAFHLAPHRRMAPELGEEFGLILNGSLLAAATRAKFDKLAVDRFNLRLCVYRRTAA